MMYNSLNVTRWFYLTVFRHFYPYSNVCSVCCLNAACQNLVALTVLRTHPFIQFLVIANVWCALTMLLGFFF